MAKKLTAKKAGKILEEGKAKEEPLKKLKGLSQQSKSSVRYFSA